MGSFSITHLLLLLAVVLLLFGAGKLPRVMGDFAKGIKAFKSGMKESEEADAQPPAQVSSTSQASAGTTSATERKAHDHT